MSADLTRRSLALAGAAALGVVGLPALVEAVPVEAVDLDAALLALIARHPAALSEAREDTTSPNPT